MVQLSARTAPLAFLGLSEVPSSQVRFAKETCHEHGEDFAV